VKALTGFVGLVVAALLGLYGVFLILYQGEEGSEGDAYMDFGGTRVDADYIGGPLALVSLALLIFSLRALRRSRVP
jgi:hypothetical protein